MAEGARCKQVEMVLEEIEAVRHAMSRANRGDLVVVCVDKHAEVMTELENWSAAGPGRLGRNPDAPAADPDYAPATERPVGPRRERPHRPDAPSRWSRRRASAATVASAAPRRRDRRHPASAAPR